MTIEETGIVDAKKILRGRTSPSYTLSESIEAVKKVHTALGASPATRETIAEALGHSPTSGTAGLKVGALTHFHLLDGRGNNYTISPIGMQIIMPTSEGEVETAIAQAAKSPSLYAELIEEFSGKALPQMLANLLHRKYSVSVKACEEVAQKFRESMEFAGLLRNGILYSDLPQKSSQPSTNYDMSKLNGRSAPDDEKFQSDFSPKVTRPSDGSVQQYTVPLGKSGRVASISLPLPVLASDLKKLQSWLNFMGTVLEEDVVSAEENEGGEH